MAQLTAIVAGSTGLIGSYLVDVLQDDQQYGEVILFNRSPKIFNSNKIKEVLVNFDELESVELNTQIDIGFCCLGTTMKTAGSKDAFYKVDFTYCLEFAKLAKKLGAKKFILVSSLGADAKSSNFYLKVKGQIEEAIENLGFEAFYVIMRPSMLLGDRRENRIGEAIGKAVMTTFDFLLAGPFRKYKAIHGKKVAVAMAKAGASEFEGKVIFESDKIAAY